ncbi:MAG: chemotaxis protein CheW [Proteobacteria bacterium]|nr:chemotaxis protein CheW [Pseudomonadota bacterium]MBU1687403.1 chemotaxis protein CheW [Pseudomonadota bacterium]
MAEQLENRTREGKYLTFELGAEQYGIGIMQVKESIGMQKVTPRLQSPHYLKGVKQSLLGSRSFDS